MSSEERREEREESEECEESEEREKREERKHRNIPVEKRAVGEELLDSFITEFKSSTCRYDAEREEDENDSVEEGMMSSLPSPLSPHPMMG